MSARTPSPLSVRQARRRLLMLIICELAVFTASYFYFTTMHALESFDTDSCIPLNLSSNGCVSSLQALLNEDKPYPAISADGTFGPQTERAVKEFQSIYHLKQDGDVGTETARAINEYSPRPDIIAYTAGFVNSKLMLSAKLCVASLEIAVAIVFLLLKAARAGTGRLFGIRCLLAGLFTALIAANTAASQSLIAEDHSWVAKFLFVILMALTAALTWLIGAMFAP